MLTGHCGQPNEGLFAVISDRKTKALRLTTEKRLTILAKYGHDGTHHNCASCFFRCTFQITTAQIV